MRRFAVAVLLCLAACSSATTASSGTKKSIGNRNVITLDEIQTTRSAGWTAWDLIHTLRPNFLTSRGVNSFQSTVSPTAAVYLDGVRYGDISSLKTLTIENIKRIEYMSGSDATTRYGTDHPGGAILISTR